MPEAVIVSAARSPIGRAGKGSLKEMRPDELTAQMVRGRARAGPGARPDRDHDLILGMRAARGGSRGNNLGVRSPC